MALAIYSIGSTQTQDQGSTMPNSNLFSDAGDAHRREHERNQQNRQAGIKLLAEQIVPFINSSIAQFYKSKTVDAYVEHFPGGQVNVSYGLRQGSTGVLRGPLGVLIVKEDGNLLWGVDSEWRPSPRGNSDIHDARPIHLERWQDEFPALLLSFIKNAETSYSRHAR
jgi:hypothetical protein